MLKSKIMKLIIGLGNPGEEYKNTRHNAGYLVVDQLKSKISNSQSPISNQIKIFKSDKFMNESGVFVKHLISKYPNISISDLYIIHDDLDIKLGEYKIQLGHSPKDHNGIKSVDQELGTDQYWHVKIGIDNRPLDARPIGVEYVLQNFTDEERKILDQVIHKVVKSIITTVK